MPTDDQTKQQGGGATGAGGEAAAGMHATREQDDERPGSEPLGRDREHSGSYGGAGGAPRTSSDTREPQTPS